MDEPSRSAARALLADRRGLSTMEYSVLLVLLLLGGLLAWRSLGSALRVKVESGSAVLAEALAEGSRAADGNASVSSTARDTHAAVEPARSQALSPAATSNGASPDRSLAGGTQVRSGSAATRSASAVTTRATSGGIVSVAQTALSTSISAAKAVWDTWQEVREGMIADEVRYLQAHPDAMLTLDPTRAPSPRELRSAAEARFLAQGFALGPLKVLGAASKGALAGRLLGKVKSLFGVQSDQVATRAGTRPRYAPVGADGKPLPLPRGPNGEVAPSSMDPHTQIGMRTGRKGDYPQTREFGPNGQPVKQVDWTNHGRPNAHTDPHVHDYVPNPTGGTPQHGPARAPRPGEIW
jgi:Flp pilus assembly protein TadG